MGIIRENRFLTDGFFGCEGCRQLPEDPPRGVLEGHNGLVGALWQNPGEPGEKLLNPMVTGVPIHCGDLFHIVARTAADFGGSARPFPLAGARKNLFDGSGRPRADWRHLRRHRSAASAPPSRWTKERRSHYARKCEPPESSPRSCRSRCGVRPVRAEQEFQHDVLDRRGPESALDRVRLSRSAATGRSASTSCLQPATARPATRARSSACTTRRLTGCRDGLESYFYWKTGALPRRRRRPDGTLCRHRRDHRQECDWPPLKSLSYFDQLGVEYEDWDAGGARAPLPALRRRRLLTRRGGRTIRPSRTA